MDFFYSINSNEIAIICLSNETIFPGIGEEGIAITPLFRWLLAEVKATHSEDRMYSGELHDAVNIMIHFR